MSKEETMRATDNLIEYTRALYDRSLVHASGGNTSIRVEDQVWITRTGAVLGDVSESDLTRVTLDGKVLQGDRPSKELGMHLSMYKARPGAKAIIHVHPTYAIAYSTLLSEESLDAVPAYTAACYLRAGRVPMIGYFPSGSAELHQAVARLAPCYHAILLRQHGVIVAAEDMGKAMGIIEEIEQCCRIVFLTDGRGVPITEAQKKAIDQKLDRTWMI
jgi:ribulose-5-phosphate 4-epimerase/fuculose-1-phosphate aldolase